MAVSPGRAQGAGIQRLTPDNALPARESFAAWATENRPQVAGEGVKGRVI